MVEISPQLVCLFSAALEERDGGSAVTDTPNGSGAAGTQGTYTVDIPRRAVETGQLEPGRTYRVAILDQVDRGDGDRGEDGDGHGVGEGDGAGNEARGTGRASGSTGDGSGASEAGGTGGTGGPVGGNADGDGRSAPNGTDDGTGGRPEPPVDEGEVRTVTVEAEGDQGDGIAKVERGYVVIVPGAEPGDQPTVEITTVRQNVAFAELRD